MPFWFFSVYVVWHCTSIPLNFTTVWYVHDSWLTVPAHDSWHPWFIHKHTTVPVYDLTFHYITVMYVLYCTSTCTGSMTILFAIRRTAMLLSVTVYIVCSILVHLVPRSIRECVWCGCVCVCVGGWVCVCVCGCGCVWVCVHYIWEVFLDDLGLFHSPLVLTPDSPKVSPHTQSSPFHLLWWGGGRMI